LLVVVTYTGDASERSASRRVVRGFVTLS